MRQSLRSDVSERKPDLEHRLRNRIPKIKPFHRITQRSRGSFFDAHRHQ